MTDLPPEIAQKYRAIRILGEGGFGTVWEATRVDNGQPVALKVLSDKAFTDVDAVERFRHEALVASKISHPSVVSVLDYGVEGSHGYIALPLIVGCTLRDRIRKGPLPTGQAMLIAIALADALAEIHRQGVIHRDLKPENVLLENNERALLTDFGISKSATSSVQTREGIIFGTPGYVAPEQLEHERASPASDQYSLGVIVYEMLAGRRPFTGDSPAEEAMARVKGPAPGILLLVPRLDPGVADVIMKMLNRKPEGRFKDMRTVQRSLQVATMKMPSSDRDSIAIKLPPKESAGGSLSSDTPVPGGAPRPAKPSQTVSMSKIASARPQTVLRVRQEEPRSKAPIAAAVAIGLIALGGGVFYWSRQAPPPLHRTETPPRQADATAPMAIPTAFPRIGQPDCAKLEGPGGRITPVDVARCEVKRWFSSLEKAAGRPVGGDLLPIVREQKTPKDAQALLELFQNAAASRAEQALGYLRDSSELAFIERFDAGMVALKARTAHAACLWQAFGSGLGASDKFPEPKFFLAPAANFYPDWDKLWANAAKGTWEQQAWVLAEWIAFHRTLEEERIDWGPVQPAISPAGAVEDDAARGLARIWRLRLRHEPLAALALLRPVKKALERPATPEGKQATLEAWAGVEGCLASLFAKDLAGANRAAVEARRALARVAEDPGARRLGIASWPEWRQMGALGK